LNDKIKEEKALYLRLQQEGKTEDAKEALFRANLMEKELKGEV